MLNPATDQPNAKIVEGSDGLLLEIDGQIVPNYDATVHPFQEGDVVTGHIDGERHRFSANLGVSRWNTAKPKAKIPATVRTGTRYPTPR